METEQIRVFICDDTPEVVRYFSMALEKEKDVVVVGSAYSAAEAFGMIVKTKPQIVLMDIQMETGEAGIELTQRLKNYDPDIKVIIITIHKKDDLIFKAYMAGAIDYIQKTASIVEIISAIREVYDNKLALRPEVAHTILDEFSRLKKQEASMLLMMNLISTLTNAEMDVLAAFCEGKKRSTVAKERVVEISTINKQITSILKKTGAKSIKTLVKELEQSGVIGNIRRMAEK